MGRSCSMHGKDESAYNILVGKTWKEDTAWKT